MSNFQIIDILAPELEFLKLVQKTCVRNTLYIISLLNLQLCLEIGSVILTVRDGAGYKLRNKILVAEMTK